MKICLIFRMNGNLFPAGLNRKNVHKSNRTNEGDEETELGELMDGGGDDEEDEGDDELLATRSLSQSVEDGVEEDGGSEKMLREGEEEDGGGGGGSEEYRQSVAQNVENGGLK